MQNQIKELAKQITKLNKQKNLNKKINNFKRKGLWL